MLITDSELIFSTLVYSTVQIKLISSEIVTRFVHSYDNTVIRSGNDCEIRDLFVALVLTGADI